MNIVLCAINSKYIHSNLSIWYLIKSCPYKILPFEGTINENPGDLYAKISDLKPDILAFSCYIWNIETVKKLVLKFKDIPIILGGPEVSFNPEFYLNNFNNVKYVFE